MTFISYAQNYEDVMLWRALKHIQKGFYIDVGAWSPDLDSVTRLFYENGWCGVNIEPNPDYHALLEERREKDINLRVAISDELGLQDMNFFSNPGLSTLDKSVARMHSDSGLDINIQQVDVTLLENVWNDYVPTNQEVHFLKIDVEGLEEEVIRGNDWVCNRPWIVVVEATTPMSQDETYKAWESILLSSDYQFVYADGLNRFYVSKEHSDLALAFKYPPNVFDEFKTNLEIQTITDAQEAKADAQQAITDAQEAKADAQQAITDAQQAITDAQEAKADAQEAITDAQQAKAKLHSVYISKSWRITAPLRWVLVQFKKLCKYRFFISIKTLVKRVVKSFYIKSMVSINAHPVVRFRLVKLIKTIGLYRFLQPFILSSQSDFKVHCKFEDLNPQAQRIYFDLKEAIEKHKTESA